MESVHKFPATISFLAGYDAGKAGLVAGADSKAPDQHAFWQGYVMAVWPPAKVVSP